MKKFIPLLMSLLFLMTGCDRLRTYEATDAAVRFVGRTENTGQGVSFDWSGVYADIRFKGSYLAMTVSDSQRNYFNLTIDGTPQEKFSTAGDSLCVVLFNNPQDKGEHCVRIQKATEGEQGRVTIHSFTTDGHLLAAESARPHHIEFYGDSLTCGYGTESESGDEPFKPETENCRYTYAAYTADYFGTDYNLVSHSGRGVVRNYGDANPVSDKAETMSARAFRLFDLSPESVWHFDKSPYHPDAVVVTLGTNDFSTAPQPDAAVFAAAYRQLIERIRAAYGQPQLPVVCVVHSPLALEPVRRAIDGLPRIAVADVSWGVYNRTTDLGASEHPNRYGHEKIADIVIEQVAALTGWQKAEIAANTSSR